MYRKKQEEIIEILKKSGVDNTAIASHEDYVKPLMRFFHQRAR
jgi:hypothetical protein